MVGYYATRALIAIVLRKGSDRARLLIAEGVLAALGFMAAGTLLKMLVLQTWPQIRAFAVIVTLRTLLKVVFATEKKGLENRARPEMHDLPAAVS